MSDPQPSINWTGDLATCTVGDISMSYKLRMLKRLNYFRALAGIGGTLGYDESLDYQQQASALLLSSPANGKYKTYKILLFFKIQCNVRCSSYLYIILLPI